MSIRSQKNQEKYAYDGFIYVKDRVSSTGDRIFWRCDLLNHGCKGLIFKNLLIFFNILRKNPYSM
jgi:hypothetical protein